MTSIGFVGATGGAGTTTITVAVAAMLDTEPVSWDSDTLNAIRGAPVTHTAAGAGRVVDYGTFAHVNAGLTTHLPDHTDKLYVVVRGPSYHALRAVIAHRPYGGIDGIVLVHEPGRALDKSDVETSTGLEIVATVSHRPEIARAVDAGTLTARAPRWLTWALGPVTLHANHKETQP